MNKKVLILIAIFLFSQISSICYADMSANIEKFIGLKSAESSHLKKVIKSEAKETKELIKLITQEEDEKINFDINNAYKLYYLKSDIADVLNDKKITIKDIATYYEWIVPFENKKNEFYFNLIIQKDENGEFKKVNGSNESMYLAEKYKNIQNKKYLRKAIKENKISSIKDFKFIQLVRYATTIAYINSEEGEYVIPFSIRDDITGLENGKMYKLGDAINTLRKNFNSSDTIDENGFEVPNGAGPGPASFYDVFDKDTFLKLYPYILGLLLIAVGIFLIRRLRKGNASY